MEYGCYFYPLCDILKKDKNKSCLGDGAGRVNESGASIDRKMTGSPIEIQTDKIWTEKIQTEEINAGRRFLPRNFTGLYRTGKG